VLLEFEVLALELDERVVVLAELGLRSLVLGCEALEVVAQVRVYLRDDPVLDLGFCGELNDREGAG
jgi:hypothetical protein